MLSYSMAGLIAALAVMGIAAQEDRMLSSVDASRIIGGGVCEIPHPPQPDEACTVCAPNGNGGIVRCDDKFESECWPYFEAEWHNRDGCVFDMYACGGLASHWNVEECPVPENEQADYTTTCFRQYSFAIKFENVDMGTCE